VAVPNTTSIVSYVSDGATKVFSVPFPFQLSSDLHVSKISLVPVETVLTEGTDYIVSGAGSSSGGSVALTVAVTAGWTVRIRRLVPLTQLRSFRTQGQFSPAAYEAALDKVTQAVQQLNDGVLLSAGTYPFGGDATAGAVVAAGGSVARTIGARAGDVAHVLDYGAQWTNSDAGPDSTAAFQAAVNSGKVAVIPPAPVGYWYRQTAPVEIGGGEALVGLGSAAHARVRTYHTGPVFLLFGTRATLKHVDIEADAARQWNYVAVKLDGSAAKGLTTNCIVEDVRVANCRVGLWGSGDVYVCHVRSIGCYRFDDFGILFDNTEGGSSSPQGNLVVFTELYGRDKVSETAAIKTAGSVNLFEGGELAGSKYLFWGGAGSYHNRVVGAFGEDATYLANLEAGATLHWDSHSAAEPSVLHADSRLIGPSGTLLARGVNAYQRALRAQKGLKAAWMFAEGTGSKVYDLSGNGQHLTTKAGTLWEENGRWGKGLLHDPANTRGVNAVPLATLDWTQPFTVALLVRREANLSTPAILSFLDAGGRYLRLERAAVNTTISTWDGVTLGSSVLTSMQDSPDDGWGWAIAYFDPPNQTIRLLDPVRGPNNFAPNPAFKPWVIGGGAGVSEVHLMHNGFSTQGMKGVLSLGAFWNRQVQLDEVLELVNMRAPQLWAHGGAEIARLFAGAAFEPPEAGSLILRGRAPGTSGTDVAVKVCNTVDLTANGSPMAWYRGDGTTELVRFDRFGSGIHQAGVYGTRFEDLSSGRTHRWGAGSPEGVVTAGIGSTYGRTDGGAGSSFYVKESGTGNTGWVAK
jgi:hypothetical protein